jgi:hypothetical protein
MLRRVPYFAALLFLISFASSLRASPPIGAVVQTWHYDPQTNIVTLKIANTSHKDITAFNIAIKETYANGRVEEHEMLEELVGKILRAKELQGTLEGESFRKQFGDGGFHPGEVRDEKLPVQPGLTNYQAVIDVVAYIDGTADADNAAGLERIVDERKAAVASKKMATEIIQTALADANDTDPSTTAAREIQDRATIWKAQRHTKIELDTVLLESVANELKTLSSRNANKRDALKQIVNREEARVSVLSVHAALVKTGGPQ